MGKGRRKTNAKGKFWIYRTTSQTWYLLGSSTSSKKMRRYLKLDEGITPIEDIEETITNEATNDRREDEIEIVEAIESRISREVRIQSWLVQATKAHELLAASFWEAHLLKEGNTLFPTIESDCEEV
jgi:hypothetical protein